MSDIILEWTDLSLDPQNEGKKNKGSNAKDKGKTSEKSIADQTVQAAMQLGVLVRYLPIVDLEHNFSAKI